MFAVFEEEEVVEEQVVEEQVVEEQVVEEQLELLDVEKDELAVHCHNCPHSAVLFFDRGTVLTNIRCSECGTRGPVADFLTPRGERAPDAKIALVSVR
jgi:ribosomal protein S27E